MDDVDRKIIEVLRAAGRTSYVALAKEVGLSSPAVHERVNKLETLGVITGYHASVDPALVGLGVTALVGIYTGGSSDDRLLERLRAMPEIEDCMYVVGDETYFVKVRVTDMNALERSLVAIGQLPGVTRTRSTIALSTKWEGRAAGSDHVVPEPGEDDAQPALAADDAPAAPAKNEAQAAPAKNEAQAAPTEDEAQAAPAEGEAQAAPAAR